MNRDRLCSFNQMFERILRKKLEKQAKQKKQAMLEPQGFSINERWLGSPKWAMRRGVK